MSWQIFEAYSYTKINEIPSSGSRVVPHAREGWHMTKGVAAFRDTVSMDRKRTARLKTRISKTVICE